MHHHRVLATAGFVVGLVMLAAPPAFSQIVTVESDDAAYCKKLAGMYERYGRSANTSNSMDTNAALNNCTNERAAEAHPAAREIAARQRVQPAGAGDRHPAPVEYR